jgi:hypothetical protein
MTQCMIRLAISAAPLVIEQVERVERDRVDVDDPAHDPVGDLRGPLVIEHVEGGEQGRSASGPDGTSRTSAGNRSRSDDTLEPMPVSGPSQPSSKPNLRRIAHSLRAVPAGPCSTRPRAISACSRGKWSGPPGVGSAHTSSSRKSGATVDPPGPGGVRGVREPHSRTSHPYGSRRPWERPVWQSTMGRSYSSAIPVPATILSTTLGGTAQRLRELDMG